MKFLITEEKLKGTIFTYLDNVFKDSFPINQKEHPNWEGLTIPGLENEILLGYEIHNPSVGFVWGAEIGWDTMKILFDLNDTDIKYYVKDYVNEKLGFNFKTLL